MKGPLPAGIHGMAADSQSAGLHCSSVLQQAVVLLAAQQLNLVACSAFWKEVYIPTGYRCCDVQFNSSYCWFLVMGITPGSDTSGSSPFIRLQSCEHRPNQQILAISACSA
jgi:hypothetical protein